MEGFCSNVFFCLGPLSGVAQTCDVGGAVTVPEQRRESGANFFSPGWSGLLVCVSSVVWCAGGGSMVCEIR